MKWKLVAFGIALAAIVCAGQDFAEELTITQLRIPKSDGRVGTESDIVVCYSTVGVGKYKSATLEAQEITDSGEGKAWEASAMEPDAGCFTFATIDIESLETLPLKFILKTTKTEEDGAKDGLGISDVIMPEKNNYPKSTVGYKIGISTAKKTIRLNEGLGEKAFYINNFDLPPYNCPSDIGAPCYFMKTFRLLTSFYVCIPDIQTIANDDSPLLFCAEVKDADMQPIEKEEAAVTKVTLEHISPDSISLATTCGTDKLCTKADVVIQKDSDVLNQCNTIALGTLSCSTVTNVKALESYSVFIAYTNDDGSVVYSFDDKTTIINRILQGTKLTPEVMEVSWSFKDASDDKFQIHREPQESGFHTANVDCSHVSGTCYVYFTDLTAISYDLTLNEINKWEDTISVDDDQEKVAGDMSLFNHIEDVGVENIQVKQDIDDKMAKFSFNHKYEISNKTTQYEVILINDKGNWKKSLMTPTIDENQKYSTSIMFPIEQLDKDSRFTMIVLARDVYSGKVLATGEKTLQVSVVQSIKPEVDNGSKGSTSTLAIIGAAIGGIACLMALVAAAIMFVMKIKRDNDGLQYPLHRTNIEQDSSYIHGLDNPIPTM